MSAPQNQTILIVDPDSDFIEWVQKHLAAPSLTISGATSGEDALALTEATPADVVLTELHIGPMNGMQLLQRLRQQNPNAMVILTTGFPMTSAIIEAMKFGAYEFLRKEALAFELRAIMESALKAKDALDLAALDSNDRKATETTATNSNETFIGNAPAMQEVFKMIGRVSRATAPVMITGESGVGKEVVAKAIHRFSARASNDFVAINCAAIPSNLLESELFGHEKGAFTGAISRRQGRFEQCTNGTLFLDEIGDMPLEVQSKLLRVLQERQYSRVGGNETLTTEARIVAATNKQLEDEVTDGEFREDLFYRLNVVRIHIPPLRQRLEDIPPLAKFFLQRMSGSNSRNAFQFSQEALETLLHYNWPGNVRELENTIQRAVVMANTNLLLPQDIPLGRERSLATKPEADSDHLIHLGAVPSATSNGDISVEQAIGALFDAAMKDQRELLPWLEKEFTQRAMDSTRNNQVQSAKLLGITRATLRKRLERFEISKDSAPGPNP